MFRIVRFNGIGVALHELRAMRPYWYIATPYSKYPGGLDAAFHEAALARAELIKLGIPNFTPIVHTHLPAVHGGIDPKDRALWLRDNQPFVDTAGGMIIVKMIGWQESEGISQEYDDFTAASKPVLLMEWPR